MYDLIDLPGEVADDYEEFLALTRDDDFFVPHWMVEGSELQPPQNQLFELPLDTQVFHVVLN